MCSFRRVPFHLLLAVFVGARILAPGATAQEAWPSPDDLPMAAAPLGLGAIILPTDSESIQALFVELPDAIRGEDRVPQVPGADRIQAHFGVANSQFGPPMVLSATSFQDGDLFPADFTAGMFVAMASMTDDYDATSFGRNGTLAWIRAETSVGVAGNKPGTPAMSQPMFTLAWGDVDSPWLFTAAATSPEGLDALVAAFALAASGHSATPVAETTPSWTIGIFGSAGRGHIMVGIDPIHPACSFVEARCQ